MNMTRIAIGLSSLLCTLALLNPQMANAQASPQPNAAYVEPYGIAPGIGGGGDVSRNAYVQSLLLQRQSWLSRPVSLVTPIVLTAVGAGLAITGFTLAGMQACDAYYDTCETNGTELSGVFLAVSGSVLATVGTSILIGRLIRRGRRGRELRRIDGELRGLGVQASVAPWVGAVASNTSFGLSTKLRF